MGIWVIFFKTTTGVCNTFAITSGNVHYTVIPLFISLPVLNNCLRQSFFISYHRRNTDIFRFPKFWDCIWRVNIGQSNLPLFLNSKEEFFLIGKWILRIEFLRKEVFDFNQQNRKIWLIKFCDQDYTFSKLDFQRKCKNFMARTNGNISEKISSCEIL